MIWNAFDRLRKTSTAEDEDVRREKTSSDERSHLRTGEHDERTGPGNAVAGVA